MKGKNTLLAAVLISGSLGMAPGLSRAQDAMWPRDDSRPKSVEDDSTLAPDVPGVTDDNAQKMSRSEALELETTLADNGYDPGPVDGIIDSETRAAIQDFQLDHQLAATGIIDPLTGELLGVVIFQST
jgi:peptidoglycan hydrolase-like protein with peptidoglycan-binding domain